MIDWEAIGIINDLLKILESLTEGNREVGFWINILKAKKYIYDKRGPIFEEKKELIDWVGHCKRYNHNHYGFYQNQLTGDIVQAQCKAHAANLFGCKGNNKLVKRIFRVTWDKRITKE
jgi:hypothetical protein